MNIYEKLNKINDAESLSEKYNVKNSKELKKLQEAEELTNSEKIMRALDKWPDKSKTTDANISAAEEEDVKELLRKREAAHKEVWNLIHDLRVKYKYSLREIEDIIDYELKHTVYNVEVD